MSQIFFSKDHEWVKIEDNLAIIGITEFAQQQLGDVVFVELPETNANLEKGKEFAVVESVKAASEVYAPLSGKVVETNHTLIDNPALVNEAPETKAWFVKIELSAHDTSHLMSETEYRDYIKDLG